MLRLKVHRIASHCNSMRVMATLASKPSQIPPFQFHVDESLGIKIASRDDGTPTSALSVVIRAGSRYQTIPGLAHTLEKFAFKSTSERTTLRITRESELLGGQLYTSVTRDSIILTAEFFRDDLPYYVELFGNVLSSTKLERHVLMEDVIPQLALEYSSRSSLDIASDALHHAAFRRGLGNTLYSNPENPVLIKDVMDFAHKSFVAKNLSVVATGVDSAQLKDLVKQHFADIPTGSPAKKTGSTYYGGDVRISSPSKKNIVILGFPGVSWFPASPELIVLNNLLGGKSCIKWSSGNSLLSQLAGEFGEKPIAFSQFMSHSDAGILTIALIGPSTTIRELAKAVFKTILSIPKSDHIKEADVKRAISQSKFQLINAFENRTSVVESIGQSLIGAELSLMNTQEIISALDKVTLAQVKSAASDLMKKKASLVALGDTHILPYADELSSK